MNSQVKKYTLQIKSRTYRGGLTGYGFYDTAEAAQMAASSRKSPIGFAVYEYTSERKLCKPIIL